MLRNTQTYVKKTYLYNVCVLDYSILPLLDPMVSFTSRFYKIYFLDKD